MSLSFGQVFHCPTIFQLFFFVVVSFFLSLLWVFLGVGGQGMGIVVFLPGNSVLR